MKPTFEDGPIHHTLGIKDRMKQIIEHLREDPVLVSLLCCRLHGRSFRKTVGTFNLFLRNPLP
jgi:hypothetical protein